MRKHIIVLDGLRGIAALGVGTLHAHQLLIRQSEIPNRSYLAVDFFFCLSGYIIAFAYQDRLLSGMSFRAFFVGRIIRLYPMFLVGMLMGCAVYLLGAHHPIAESLIVCLASIALLPAGLIFGREAFPTNNPSWSLFFELIANVIYGLLDQVSVMFLSIFLVISGACLIYAGATQGRLADIGFQSLTSFILGFVRVAFPFAAGVFIHRTSLVEKISVPAFIPIAILLIAILLPAEADGYIDPLISILIFPLVVTLGAGAKLTSGATVLAALGRMSYPFYIIHQPIIRIVKNSPGVKYFTQLSPIALQIAALGLALAASYVFVIWFDEPIRRKLGAWYNLRQAGVRERNAA